MTAAQRLAAEQPAVERCVYLPWDRAATRAWLRALDPDVVVVIETEIWPNLFAGCAIHRIPLCIANGRIRVRDVPRYRLARRLFRRVLACADWIGVQSAREREAFISIGARPGCVEIAGNLKFDSATEDSSVSADLAVHGRPRRLIVAGSTHAPEERWLLDCVRALARDGSTARIVLAPRDVGRAGRVARLASDRGLSAVAWSALARARDEAAAKGRPHAAGWDVLVLDRLGSLTSFYRAADVVFVGGTLARVGGHNILEPAAAARPILVGPYVAEIEALVEQFEVGGAIMRLSGNDPVAALVRACRLVLDDPERARRMGSAAGRICRAHVGSADRHCGAILARVRRRERAGTPDGVARGATAC
jgi:3-deoxy-D-manno-octulosonic-acid transferase